MAKLYELTSEQVKILRQGLMLLEQERRKPLSFMGPALPGVVELIVLEHALQTPVRDKEQGE